MSNIRESYKHIDGHEVIVPLTFFEEEHKYVYDPTGELFTSCTTVIGKYKPEFDTDLQARRYANRHGFDYQDVINDWEQKKETACNYGTEVHMFMEDVINNNLSMLASTNSYQEFTQGTINYNNLYKSFKWIMENVFKSVGVEMIIPEGLLWDAAFLVSGMADVIVDHPGKKFSILDFKTNKKYRYWNDFNEKMLDPLEYMHVCEHTSYSIQLSVYAYLYSRITGRELHSIIILFLDRKLSIWKPIYCSYLKHQVDAILKRFAEDSKECK